MKIQTTGTASYPGIEMLAANTAETYLLGEALVLSGGKATKCGATAKPEYICYGKAENGEVPAIRVTDAETYAAPLTAAGTSLVLGSKVTLATDGVGVTATTSSGVAEIVGFETEAKAVGDLVYIKF